LQGTLPVFISLKVTISDHQVEENCTSPEGYEKATPSNPFLLRTWLNACGRGELMNDESEHILKYTPYIHARAHAHARTHIVDLSVILYTTGQRKRLTQSK